MFGYCLSLAFGLYVATSTLAGSGPFTLHVCVSLLTRTVLCLAALWPTCDNLSLIDASAEELQLGLKRGCFSSVDLVEVSIYTSYRLY